MWNADIFTCMRGHKLYHVYDTSKGQVYEARRGCKSCPLRKQCMLSQAAKHDYKRLTIDIEAERYRRKSEALITSDEGIEIRINRSIQAEEHRDGMDDPMHGRQCPQIFHTACELPGRYSFLVQDRTTGQLILR